MAFETTKQIKFVASVDGADKVRAGFRGIGDSMTGMQKAASFASNALAGIVGAAGAGVFVGLVHGAIEAKARLYDLSLQTGISVEKLGGLSKVALLSGTDMATVASASNKLSKALETTNEDSEGAALGIKALGLNYKEFKALAPEDQLLKVAQTMEGFADGAGKSSAAMLLFGKTGAELLPFMKELAERGIMVTKQTTESALAAKEFADNLILLKGAGEGFGTSVANALLPALVEVTKELVKIKEGGSEANVVVSGLKVLFETIVVLGANVAFVFGGIGREIGAIAAQGAALARGDFAGIRAISEAVKADGVKAREELDAFEKRLLQVKDLATKNDFLRGDKDTSTKPKPKVVTPDLDALRKAREEAERRQKAALKELQDEAKARSDIRQAESKAIAEFELQEQQRRNKEVELARKSVTQAQAEFDQHGMLRSEIELLTLARLRDKQAAFEAGSANYESVQLEIDAQKELIGIIASGERRDKTARNDPLAGADRAVKSYLDDVEAAGLATERAVGDAIKSLEDGMTQLFTKGSFDARAFVDQLISEFVRLAIIKPMLASIFETGSAGGGSLAANLIGLFAAGYTSDPGLASNGFSTTAGISGGRAMGGPVSAGEIYPVGERGPELFVPNTSGSIVANGKLGASITFAPTINIDSRSDRAQVAQQTAQAVQAGNKQLVDMLRARGIM